MEKLKEEKELAIIDLQLALKKAREQSTYLSLDKIVEIIKEIFTEEELKIIKQKL